MRIYARDVFEAVSDQIVVDFDNRMNSLVSNMLGALAAPFSALIVLWVIVTGILVMRGDIDVRRGITRIIRVALVSAFILEAGVYNTYVVQFFRNGLPNWIASTITSGQALSTPEMLDDIMARLSGTSAMIKALLSIWQVSDHQRLAIIDTCNGLMLGEVFTIYLCAQVVMDVVLTIGPFVIAGFLFEATRGFAEKWIGQMVGLILLSAMVDISVKVFADGINAYLYKIALDEFLSQGLGAVAIGAMFNVTIFVTICAAIVNLLPAVAAIIGGGIEVRSAGSAMSSVVGGPSSGSRTANNIARRMFK